MKPPLWPQIAQQITNEGIFLSTKVNNRTIHYQAWLEIESNNRKRGIRDAQNTLTSRARLIISRMKKA